MKEFLNQNDSFIGGIYEEYKTIISLCRDDEKMALHISQDCFVRGGCFWSDYNKNVIAGKISHGKQYTYKEFLKRLKNSISK